MSKQLLMVFVKNPRLGKVKTRLAATLGNHKALEIYHLLLEKTKVEIMPLMVDKEIHYSDFIDQDDLWSNHDFRKFKQSGEDLGTRMSNAFKMGFEKGYDSICIIGSDCFDITSDIIDSAFKTLNACDFVIGPANDGGYYLLGMTKYNPSLFKNMAWSTSKVLEDSIQKIKVLGASFQLLQTLTDVDEEKDLVTIENFLNNN